MDMTMVSLEGCLANLGPLARAIRCEPARPAQELETRLIELADRCEAINARAEADGRDLSEDEEREIDRLYGEFERVDAELSATRAASVEGVRGRLRGTGRRTDPSDLLGEPGGGGGAIEPAGRRTGDPRLLRNLFAGQTFDNDGWRDQREFFRAVARGLADQRFRAAAGMSEDVGQDGGFMVPPRFIAELLDRSLEDEIVRPRARVVPATSNSFNAPMFDDQDHSASVSGFVGEWLGEGAPGTPQKAKVRSVVMRVAKLAIFTAATNEWLEDAAMFESAFRAELLAAIGFYLDDAFLNGNGVGKPLGVLNVPSLVVVDKESGQSADTVVYRNLKKMFARMHPRARMRAIWIAHTDTIPELLELHATDGTTSTHVPVLKEGPDGFKMLTRPIIFTEKLPMLGDRGDILFADFSRYVIGMRRDASVQTSIHAGWQTDETHFRAILRANGMDGWSKPFTPKTGQTLGWAVTLAERA